MALVDIPEETRALLDEHHDLVKGKYITYKLFVDSAIRTKLRIMGAKVPEDKILPHLRKLKKNKRRLAARTKVARMLEGHEKRMRVLINKLDELDF